MGIPFKVGLTIALLLHSFCNGSGLKLDEGDLTSKRTRSLQLDEDGKYTLYWHFNGTRITFEVHAQTWGWIGFGISPNGKMYPADVVIGWVSDGITHFNDYHTTAHGQPVKDKHQDWFLQHGEENNYGTVLRFTRELDICDKEDMDITDQTVRLLYSFHPDDPPPKTNNIPYHGFQRRGTKSVSLLSPSLPLHSFQDEKLKYLDFRNRNYLVPDKDTTYLCTGFQLPDFGGKHHIVGFEPIFTPGNQKYVHHLDILKCRGSYHHLNMATGECLDEWPEGWPVCAENLLAWGTGGGAFYFPDHTGYSIGAEGDAVFYVMQIHYNNPSRESGIIDSSGIRLKLTSKLRQYDVANIMLGHMVTTLQVIPPHEPTFISRAYCAEQCVTAAMQDANVTEIKVIAAYQHAHTLAVGITTRHFRNGTELTPIIHDPYYDFFFQEIRPLGQEVTIKQGDSFTVECTYNSLGRPNVTFGGATTKDEMCLSYIYVYPKLPLIACVSTSTYDTYSENESSESVMCFPVAGKISVMEGRPFICITTKHQDLYLKNVTLLSSHNYELHKKFQTMNWQDPKVTNEYEMALTDSATMHVCEKRRNNKSFMKTYYKFQETRASQRFTEKGQPCT